MKTRAEKIQFIKDVAAGKVKPEGFELAKTPKAIVIIFNEDESIFYDNENKDLVMDKDQLEEYFETLSKTFLLTVVYLPAKEYFLNGD